MKRSPHVESALNLLASVRSVTDCIGVGVSFGKDSLATLDLCCRVFPRVEGYYLFRVAGLRVVESWRAAVQRRYGVLVRPYPHFDLTRCYRNAVLQPHWRGLGDAAAISMKDIEDAFRRDTGVEWMAMGWRRNDSFSRALIMRKCRGIDWSARRVFPLRAWRRVDVYEYLTARRIELPPTLGRKEQGGLDFHRGALEWLRDNHPDDYQRWLRDFPFSEVQLLGAAAEPVRPAVPREKRAARKRTRSTREPLPDSALG